jgi:mRNA interferase MazF
MVREGQVVLFKFPYTDQMEGKLRPALVVRKVPGPHDDWLICMVSSQLSQGIDGFDEFLSEEDGDFRQSGLKQASVVRIGRLAVVQKTILLGATGDISPERLRRIKGKLSDWLLAR